MLGDVKVQFTCVVSQFQKIFVYIGCCTIKTVCLHDCKGNFVDELVVLNIGVSVSLKRKLFMYWHAWVKILHKCFA